MRIGWELLSKSVGERLDEAEAGGEHRPKPLPEHFPNVGPRVNGEVVVEGEEHHTGHLQARAHLQEVLGGRGTQP